jgi:hypothetical protein
LVVTKLFHQRGLPSGRVEVVCHVDKIGKKSEEEREAKGIGGYPIVLYWGWAVRLDATPLFLEDVERGR